MGMLPSPAPTPYHLTREQRVLATKDIVHEYANLRSAAFHSWIGKPPWRSHCDDAFLLGCRKMRDFLMKKQRTVDSNKELDDILALDYLPPPGTATPWRLPLWRKHWQYAMNKQLAHLSYQRDKEWDHTVWIPQLLPEFITAWEEFMNAVVDPVYRAAFAEHLRLKHDLVKLTVPTTA